MIIYLNFYYETFIWRKIDITYLFAGGLKKGAPTLMELVTTEQVMENVIVGHKRNEKTKVTYLKFKSDGTLDLRYKMTKHLFREEFKKQILLENRRHNRINDKHEGNYRQEILDLDENDIAIFEKQKN